MLGDGGIPAPGERQAAGWTTRQIPSLTQASHGVDTLRVPEPNFFAPTLRHFSRPLRPRVVNSTPPTCSGSGDVGAAEFTTLVSSPGAEVSSA